MICLNSQDTEWNYWGEWKWSAGKRGWTWGGGCDSGFTRSLRKEFVGRIGRRLDDVRTRGTVGFAAKREKERKARLRR